MSNISMDLIKNLRERTGVGIAECKLALDEARADIAKAVEILRKKGIAKAAKRESREVKEGVIKVAVNDTANEGYIVEINSETDFVARSEKFQEFSDKILEIIKTQKPANVAELINIKLNGGTVKDNLDNLSGVIGEKLDIKRSACLSGGSVAAYSHMAGRIGVLVSLSKTGERELAREIAMQVAAANPKYIKTEDVPAEEIAKEKEIYRQQLKKEGKPASAKAMAGKPESIIEKIIEGKIRKYFEEVCLVEQEYIKDEKKRVKDILEEVEVEKFIRYSL